VAVLIHGGYWRNRYHLDLMNALAADLAAVGFAVWNVEYRRLGTRGGGLPGTFTDVAAGLETVVDLASSQRLDLGRVGVIGHSAGGQLAAWLAARARTPWAREHRVAIHVVVGLAPVADLRLANAWKLSGDAAGQLVGASFDDAPELYQWASPAALLPLRVRQILVHGTADDSVPYEMSVRYQAAARAAGDDCELIGMPGVDHFALIDPSSDAWAVTRERFAAALT
jgi:acetyl esterase/lipase